MVSSFYFLLVMGKMGTGGLSFQTKCGPNQSHSWSAQENCQTNKLVLVFNSIGFSCEIILRQKLILKVVENESKFVLKFLLEI